MTAQHEARLKKMTNKEKATYLDYLAYLTQVAHDTGRVIFGQLWEQGIPDGIAGADFILSAVYADPIAEMLNSQSPLLKYLEPAPEGYPR